MTLAVGTRAPDFTLNDQNGRPVQLSQLLADGPVVLYFYPKDETTGCTIEACGFRDAHDSFVDANARIVGISRDSVDSHLAFASNHQLPFTLLSDPRGEAEAVFGVPRTMGFIPGRVTFVIDRDRTIRHVYVSQVRAKKHVEEALRIVRDLAPGDTLANGP